MQTYSNLMPRHLQAGQYRGLGLDASMDVPSIPMAMLRDTIQ
jgi:hypothetical protein